MTDADKRPKRKLEECPWYLLATLYGVPEEGDEELQTKNRAAWNWLMATRLSEEHRTALITKKSFTEEELSAFTPAEIEAAEAAFVARGGAPSSFRELTEPSVTIDFSNLQFESGIQFDVFLFSGTNFSGATFTGYAWFRNATFTGNAWFDNATFTGNAWFQNATFTGGPSFRNATFTGNARFDNATFTGGASFERATFTGGAWFRNATFTGNAWFDNATFTGYASFERATFAGGAWFRNAAFAGGASFERATLTGNAWFDNATFTGGASFGRATFTRESSFTNSEMKSETSFETAIFKTTPPGFFGAKLHQGTDWHDVTWPERPRDAETAVRFVRAYEPLKLEMDRLKKHEDELNFFALEMQAREVMYGWKGTPIREVVASPRRWLKTLHRPQGRIIEGAAIALYGTLCDYGRSYLRPIFGSSARSWPERYYSGRTSACRLSQGPRLQLCQHIWLCWDCGMFRAKRPRPSVEFASCGGRNSNGLKHRFSLPIWSRAPQSLPDEMILASGKLLHREATASGTNAGQARTTPPPPLVLSSRGRHSAAASPRRHASSSSRHSPAAHGRGRSSATDHPGMPSYATRNNTRPPPFYTHQCPSREPWAAAANAPDADRYRCLPGNRWRSPRRPAPTA